MKVTNYLLLLALIATVSCSRGTKNEEMAEGGDPSISEADFIVDAEDEQLIIEDEPLMAESEPVMEEVSLDSGVASSPQIELSSDEGQYTVKRGETLMMVAFNIYGDYRKWQDLRNLNGLSGQTVAEGSVIRYMKPVQEFVWNPEGLPYLIKNGDSLVSISSDKYGTPKKWELIYNNNRPLIKDPNLIFAGFTLYYIPEREIASEY
ncbi:MAG: LysM peptidoglycan-binding domain-containing protein [Bdellovibrionota bacterium]|jgi:nucleoid-associated protein YgaU|nr:LysM peptidoglycan-binding domain-containing protein [Bdellovibrionota bacterium]